jgi:hypothetical protein
MVKFNCTKKERALVDAIIERAIKLYPVDAKIDRVSASMDLIACHSNGCPLDFEKLLAFEDFSFAHDFSGIARHMDRETGKISNHFLPRCYKPKVPRVKKGVVA